MLKLNRDTQRGRISLDSKGAMKTLRLPTTIPTIPRTVRYFSSGVLRNIY